MDTEKKMIEKRTANGDVYYVPAPEAEPRPTCNGDAQETEPPAAREAAPRASHKRPEKGEKKEE